MTSRALPLAFALVLAAWGNVMFSLLGSTGTLPGGSAGYAAAGVALVALSIAVARAARSPGTLVLGEPSAAVPGAGLGAAAGLALALASVALLRFLVPLITGTAVAYAPLGDLAPGDLVAHALVPLPLGIVLPEELAFRGVLLALLRRHYGERAAIALSAAAFAAWHLVVIVATIGQTTLGGTLWAAPALLVAVVVLFAGGVVLALLRVRTRTIATTVAAHWTFNALVLFGLWATRAG